MRKALIETGDVDIMIAISSNFFYTRSIPCELWFLNRGKPEEHRDKVLMIDARDIYRQVTRKIYDFSPEQQQNIQAIVWLYRGETEKYLNLVAGYCRRMLDEAAASFSGRDQKGNNVKPLPSFINSLDTLCKAMQPFLATLPQEGSHAEPSEALDKEMATFKKDVEYFNKSIEEQKTAWEAQNCTNGELKSAVDRLTTLADASRDLVKQADLVYRHACRLIEVCEKECNAKDSDEWNKSEINRCRKAADGSRQLAVEQLKQVRYFWKQAHWLTERFPEAELRDVEGLVKLVDKTEIEANDWSLTPGRYVGVAPEEEDKDFDFEQTLRDIHNELDELNAEATTLGAKIKSNFEELGV